MILINKTLHQQNHFRGRDEEAQVKQERLIVLPEVLPHDSRVRYIMPA